MNQSLLALTLISVLTLFSVNQLSTSEVSELTSQFAEWKLKHNKQYDSVEEYYRFAVWADNKDKIDQNNKAGNTHVEALNMFSDLTKDEFRSQYLSGFKPSGKVNNYDESTVAHGSSIDWTQKGAVTGVKNQGQCGSCWAFGTVGGMEGRYFLETGTLQSFSEQQITSCDSQYQGCGGGNLAYDYINTYGLESESTYPYTSGGGSSGSCRYSRGQTVIKSGTVSASDVSISKSAYLSALDTQPLGICVAAGAFQSYSGGILSTACDSQIDHCVTGVGYSVSGGYARIKNSWGANWGESGYVRVSISDNAPYNGYCAIYANAQTSTYSG